MGRIVEHLGLTPGLAPRALSGFEQLELQEQLAVALREVEKLRLLNRALINADAWEQLAQITCPVCGEVATTTEALVNKHLVEVTRERDELSMALAVAEDGKRYADSLLEQQANKLTAALAREDNLLEALEYTNIHGFCSADACDKMEQALAIPRDDTALRQWGAKLLRNTAKSFAGVIAFELRCRADELEGK